MLYSEFARTLDFIGVGEIVITLSGKNRRSIAGSETFKIEMIKIQKESDTSGRFVAVNMIRISFKNNNLQISKIG